MFSSYLTTGDIKSCGCIMSYRETLIERYLINHNIQFQRQFTFQDLRGKKYPLRFDFAVFEDDGTLQCLIEYQGEQHYTNIFKIPEDDYLQSIARDKLKRKYCNEHKIPLYELNNEETIETELKRIL